MDESQTQHGVKELITKGTYCMIHRVQKAAQLIYTFLKQDSSQWLERSETGDSRVSIGSIASFSCRLLVVFHLWKFIKLYSMCIFYILNCSERFLSVQLDEFSLSEHSHVTNTEPWNRILPAPQKPPHALVTIDAPKTSSILTSTMVAETPSVLFSTVSSMSTKKIGMA